MIVIIIRDPGLIFAARLVRNPQVFQHGKRQGGERGGVQQGRPARRIQPDEAFKVAIKRVFDVEVDRRRVGLFEQQDTGGEHRGEDDAHRRPRLDPAQAADGLDHQGGEDRGPGGADQHRPCGDDAGDQEADDDAGKDDVADGVADQGLTAQDEEIARHGAGHGGERADQEGREGKGDEFVHHRAFGAGRRASMAAIWSGVSTVSIGVSPS